MKVLLVGLDVLPEALVVLDNVLVVLVAPPAGTGSEVMHGV